MRVAGFSLSLVSIGSLADKDIHDLFERVSLERVNRLLFMSNKFESESVVAALAPHYEDEACVGKEVRINQERVLAVRSDGKRTGVLVDVIRQEASKNEDFLRQFVFFVSGHSFFPASSFKMTVEFNSIESADQDQLPEAHTCDNVVKFPGTAYNGDARVLAEKLLLALECTERGGGSFSMQ